MPQINPHHNHGGGIDRPDPHKIADRARLLANVEMDSQLEEMRRKQIDQQTKQVIPKPVIKDNDNNAQNVNKPDHKSSSELAPPIEAPRGHSANDEPKITGGEDPNPEVRKKRDHVKQVRRPKISFDFSIQYCNLMYDANIG